METPTNRPALIFSRVIVAYLLAVTAAALVFVLSLILPEIINILGGTGFESSTSFDIRTKFQHLAFMTALLFVIGWIFSFIVALIPFAIGITIARRLKIEHWRYFVIGAIFTAIGLEPLFIAIPNLGINVLEPEPSFAEQFLHGLPYFLAAGTAGGVSCFMFLRRGFTAPLYP